MYLLILESIGTSELIMIGIVALIIFGPRKLPDMMRSFGKAMAEFKRSTNEFKQSWEKEVDLESFEKQITEDKVLNNDRENSVSRKTYPLGAEMTVPEITEIKAEDFERISAQAEIDKQGQEISEQISPAEIDDDQKKLESDLNNKREWL